MTMLNQNAQEDVEKIKNLSEQDSPSFKIIELEEKREIDAILKETKVFKRTLLNGYSRNDVDGYIENLKSNIGRVQKQMTEELRSVIDEKAAVTDERNVLKNQLREAEKDKKEAMESLKDMAILEEHLEAQKITIQDLKEQNKNCVIAEEKVQEYHNGILAREDHIKELENMQKENKEQILSLQGEMKESVARLTEDYEEKLRVIKEKYDVEREAHARTREACCKVEEKLRKREKENAEYKKRFSDIQEAYKKECLMRKKAEEETVKVKQMFEIDPEYFSHNAEMGKELENKNQIIGKLENILKNRMQNGNVDSKKSDEKIVETLKAGPEKQSNIFKQRLGTENIANDHYSEEDMRESIKAEYENQINVLKTQIKYLENVCGKNRAQMERVIEKAVRNRENMLKINYEERLRQSRENYDASVDSLKKLMDKKCIAIRKAVEEDVAKRYENKIAQAEEKCAEVRKEGLSLKEALEDIMTHIDGMKEREALRMEQSIEDRKKISDLLYEVAKERLKNSTSLNNASRS